MSQTIQISLKLDDPVAKEREIAGLVEAMRTYKLKEGYILTLEDEELLELDNKQIIVKPVWKWLLEFDNS